LFELGCESLYLFLLLRDRCFQLLNLAKFATERGAGRRGGPATRRRGAARRSRCGRCANRVAGNKKIRARVVVGKVYSNYTNGSRTAVCRDRLEVSEDTTDVAVLGIAPREVVDADRTAFVDAGVNEVADVSVIEAIDYVCSYPCAHECVLTAIIAIEARRTTNCRVVVRASA